jgi:Pilin accessory protein (PilO)
MANMGGDEENAEVDTGSPGFSATGGLVYVGGKAYAVGLAWEPIRDRKMASKEARSRLAVVGANLFTIRPDRNQYGMGSTLVGHKAGMPVLAVSISSVLPSPFLALFEVDGGYYLIASRDDKILADGEKLIHDAQEAQEAFDELFYTQGVSWKKTIAPKNIVNEPNVEPQTLEELLAGRRPSRGSLLQGPYNVGKYARIAGIILLLGTAYFAYGQWSDWRAREQASEDAARVAEDARRARENAEKSAEARRHLPLPPLPWEGEAAAAPVIDACVQQILAAPSTVPGWQLTTLACANGVMNLDFKNTGGTINWFGAELNHGDFHPHIDPGNDDNTVRVSWAFPKIPGAYNASTQTVGVGTSRSFIKAQFGEVFQRVDLKDETAKAIPLPGYEAGKGPQFFPYRDLAFLVSTRHDPRDFEEIAGHIPAFVISAVRLDVASWTWTIEGIIYEKLPVPPR